ncbi:MAG: TlpA family protein disulfide reductase [Bacteroidota bacterium]
MLLKSLFYLFLVITLSSCVGKERDSKISNASTATNSMVMDVSPELPYPIYDYEGLKPLLNKKDDKTYIVNFWATWCKPCLEEMPHFQRTYKEQRNSGVELILVSLDMPSMWEKRLVPYVREKDLKGEVVILDDPKMNEWIPKIAENWGGGIPATLIYSKNHRTFYERGFTYEELNTELKKFVP